MKICIIGTSANSMLRFRKALIQNMAYNENIIYAFATDYSDDTRQQIKTLGAIPIDYTLNNTGINPLSDIFATIKLSRKIKQIAPDIVFSYFSKPVIFGTLAAKLAKTPRIIGMLEGLGYSFTPTKNKIINLKKQILKIIQITLYKFSFNFIDKIILLNNCDRLDLFEHQDAPPRNIKILGGIGVNLNDFSYSQPTTAPVRFIFIGRLLLEKGITEFIDAANIIKAKHPESEFIVLGTPSSNPGSINAAQLKKLSADGIITYPGHVDDVSAWLNASSVFVLPSYREGIPCSTQEAMATGRPVITTDVPGCRETAYDNENGFLVPPQNAQALVEKMLFFIENPEKIILMGRKSREIAEMNFCATKQAEKLFGFISTD